MKSPTKADVLIEEFEEDWENDRGDMPEVDYQDFMKHQRFIFYALMYLNGTALWAYFSFLSTQDYFGQRFANSGMDFSFLTTLCQSWPMVIAQTFQTLTGLEKTLGQSMRMYIRLRVCSALTESTYYSMAALLPDPKFTTSVQIGNGAAGIVNVTILTVLRLVVGGTQENSDLTTLSFYLFFGLLLVIVISAIVLYHYLMSLPCITYLMMQVEEDPSSQFVDFTNATDSEQFVSDVEQALIGWHLANKGHASLEALAASESKRLSVSHLNRPASAVWTKELQFHLPGHKTPKSYVLSLFVAHHQIEGEEVPTRKVKKWQEGLEHFTPTMLSVADTSRDFQWGLETGEERECSVDHTSVFDDEEFVFSKKTAFKNVQKWFGVDEFLLLSRASPHEKKVMKEESGEEDTEKVEVDDEETMADIHVDQNEAGMLLSALTMALNNCNCTIPAFVPVFEPSRGTWIGSAVPGATGNVSMSFDTDSVPELNPNQSCISGLLDFFKVKLQLSPQVEEKCRVQADESGDLAIGMMVSASFGYSWDRKNSINSMSLLWVEFVKALRERWFQQQLLPFMSTNSKEGEIDHNTSSHSLDTLFLLDSDAIQIPPPDFRHCLLHQKLQLLNCCIL
ncbi:Rab3 GTPase-activating protein catalytic subunit, partial [Phytophthora palmivora]